MLTKEESSFRHGNIRSQSGEFVGNREFTGRVLGNSEVDKQQLGRHKRVLVIDPYSAAERAVSGWQGPSHWSRVQFRILGIRKETD